MDEPTPPPIAPPPPPTAPPPIIYGPPPSRRSGVSVVWKVLALVFLALLCFSVFGRIPFLHSVHLGESEPERNLSLEEMVIEPTNSQNKIAVISVDGIITSRDEDHLGITLAGFIEEQLQAAARDNDVKAVILKVNSPGGEVLASDEINASIRKFEGQTRKPVVASMGSLAASGGYYISASCRWIVANELTITGSIGVIMDSWNYRALMDKVGIQPQVFKSGRFKDMLSGEREPESGSLTPEERKNREEEDKMVQSFINETYDKFKDVVKTGRTLAEDENQGKGRALAGNWQDYADGRILTGRHALELGFVDELGDFHAAVRRAEELTGIRSASLVEYRVAVDLQTVLSHLLGKSAAPAIKVDLGFKPPVLEAGRAYYIWPKAVGQ